MSATPAYLLSFQFDTIICILGNICGDQCTEHGKYCHCGSDQPFTWRKGVYCCSDIPCVKNQDGNVTCSSGKVLNFREKCAQSCPVEESSLIFLSSSCHDQENCPEESLVSKICRNQSESVFKGEYLEECGTSFHNPNHSLKQSFNP